MVNLNRNKKIVLFVSIGLIGAILLTSLLVYALRGRGFRSDDLTDGDVQKGRGTGSEEGGLRPDPPKSSDTSESSEGDKPVKSKHPDEKEAESSDRTDSTKTGEDEGLNSGKTEPSPFLYESNLHKYRIILILMNSLPTNHASLRTFLYLKAVSTNLTSLKIPSPPSIPNWRINLGRSPPG